MNPFRSQCTYRLFQRKLKFIVKRQQPSPDRFKMRHSSKAVIKLDLGSFTIFRFRNALNNHKTAIKFATPHLMIEKQQFFELINLLNKSNKTKNETTEFLFFIEKDKLYFGQAGRQKLLISVYDSYDGWSPSSCTKFVELETLISRLLLKKTSSNIDVDKLIKESLFQKSSK